MELTTPEILTVVGDTLKSVAQKLENDNKITKEELTSLIMEIVTNLIKEFND
jgi:hypothetical protein